MPVTQKDIADRLGISITTVSRALSNSSKLSPKTRSVVLDTAAVLGYKPSRAQRNSHGDQGTTDTLGVLVFYKGEFVESGHMKMLAGISDICEAQNTGVMVHYVREEQLEQLTGSAPPELLQTDRVGGLILLNYFPPDVVKQLAARWPCVEINHHVKGLDTDVVDVDPGEGIGQLVEKLVELGHRDIGFIGDTRGYTWAHARHAAFFQAMNTLGLQYDPARFACGTRTHAEILRDWLDKRTREGVTAWVCANDSLARGVGTELVNLGYAIPDDVSLTGFDGGGRLANGRRITSILTPYEALGGAAAHRLLRRLQHPHAARPHVLIPGRVVEGETIGSPRAKQR